MSAAGFEVRATTPASRAALNALRAATAVTDGPMERHCLRVCLLAEELAARRGWGPLDSELLTVAALLHDIGLYPSASRGGVYTHDGALLARELLTEHGWEPERIERCAQAIDRHHELRSQRARGDEVEALRLADLVDASGGLIRHGLDRAYLKRLNADVPRKGLIGELAREVGRALRGRPLTVPRIFWRG